MLRLLPLRLIQLTLNQPKTRVASLFLFLALFKRFIVSDEAPP